MPRLIGVEGVAAGTAFTLSDSVITIGHAAESDIALMDNAVSRHHARLTIHDPGQGSVESNADSIVLVNNLRITQAILAPGDLLQIGDSVFRFEA